METEMPKNALQPTPGGADVGNWRRSSSVAELGRQASSRML